MNLRFRIVAGITTHLKKLYFIRLMDLLKQDSELLNSEQGQPDWIISSNINEITHDRTLKFVPRENIQVKFFYQKVYQCI